jgi:hypothetical protein
MREYMRRRRAQERAQRHKPSTGAGRPDINEGWQRVADAWREEEAAKAKVPAPALRHCLLCHEPARGRHGISDEQGHFICRACVMKAYQLLANSGLGARAAGGRGQYPTSRCARQWDARFAPSRAATMRALARSWSKQKT